MKLNKLEDKLQFLWFNEVRETMLYLSNNNLFNPNNYDSITNLYRKELYKTPIGYINMLLESSKYNKDVV